MVKVSGSWWSSGILFYSSRSIDVLAFRSQRPGQVIPHMYTGWWSRGTTSAVSVEGQAVSREQLSPPEMWLSTTACPARSADLREPWLAGLTVGASGRCLWPGRINLCVNLWVSVQRQVHSHVDFIPNSKTSDSALTSQKKYTAMHRIIHFNYIFQALVYTALFGNKPGVV